MRTVWLLLTAAIVLAVCISCPKGHKSFGGSSSPSGESESTRGGGLFGGGLPDRPGGYIDIGNGWQDVEKLPTVFGFMIHKEDIQSKKLTCSSSHVRFGGRMTASEQESRGMIAMGVAGVELLRYPSPGPTEEVDGADNSNYDKGYILLEWSLPERGLYGLKMGDDTLFFEW